MVASFAEVGSNNGSRKIRTVTRSRAVSFGTRKEATGERQKKRRRSTTDSMSLDFEHGESSVGKKGIPPSRSLSLASVSRRVGATLIDALILGGINASVLLLTGRLAQISVDSFREITLLAPLVAFLMLLNCGYVVALTTFGGQTIGKMLLGIRVVLGTDKSADCRAVLIRTAVAILSFAPLGVGYLYVAIGRSRALHDVVANTKVIRE